MPKVLNYRVIVEQDEDGIFVATAPSLQGCYTEGNTFEEVLKNIEDVIKLHIKARKAWGLPLDDSKTEFVGVKDITLNYGSPPHS
ncbi:hypothetical protein A2V80_03660 [Candidatus Woesebacteria bacterium RBG_16_39_8b]|uniref:HicB-like antitoxin of toxin-antitoxin system domain-containing protein n=1 Tax=Candidatus Woesebacteria bacterium RBG_16_39_8b TaxID=1802482 RepID=A0A1F7XFI9_9BACT|nr:MAG: hypothetical protein A2V80_03660 [Candidatus Woesebacteria bacterium RBG_16_39_8b]